MARKRASMREGPLAELFKATAAGQKQTDEEPGARRRRLRPVDAGETAPAAETIEHAPPPVPAPVNEPAPAALIGDSLPESAAQLYRAQQGDDAAYSAVIRVVGVGGA